MDGHQQKAAKQGWRKVPTSWAAPQTGSAGCAHVDRTHLGRGPQDLKMAQYDKTSVPFLCFLIRLLDTIYYIKTQMPNPVLKLRELPCEPPPAYHPHMPRLHQWTLCLKSPKAELTFSLKSFHCKHSFSSAGDILSGSDCTDNCFWIIVGQL